MPLTLAQFYGHLKTQTLKPITLIASDVTLLQQEARDALRKKTLSLGFKTVDRHFVDTAFQWDSFFSDLQNYNLFSQKTFVEVSHPNATFNEKTTKALLDYLENPPPDKYLLLLTNKLTSNQLKARWHKNVESKGISVQIRNPTKQELTPWIAERSKKLTLKLTPNNIRLLVELTQGNLLATQQALEKLALAQTNTPYSDKKILEIVSDNARYTVFELTNFMLMGKSKEALHCLHGLLATGTEATLVLWSLTREIRNCLTLAYQHRQGTPLQTLLQKEWQSRRPLLQHALKNLSYETCSQLTLLAEQADLILKGRMEGDFINCLESIILRFCGASTALYKTTENLQC